jgi:hypothetical protein
MRTSSVSEGAKIKHINLRKRQNYTPKLNTCLPRENCQNFPIYGILAYFYYKIVSIWNLKEKKKLPHYLSTNSPLKLWVEKQQ